MRSHRGLRKARRAGIDHQSRSDTAKWPKPVLTPRSRLAMKWDRLDKLESKSTITEPISLLGLATGSLRGMVQLSLVQADGGNGGLLAMAQVARQAQQGLTPVAKAPPAAGNPVPMGIVVPETGSSGSGGGGMAVQDRSLVALPPKADSSPALVQLNISGSGSSNAAGPSAPWHPAAPSGGGGEMPGRGGSGGPSAALVAASSSGGGSSRSSPSAPASTSSAGASSTLLSVLGLGAGGSAPSAAGGGAGAGAVATTVSRNSSATTLNGGTSTPSKKGLVHADTSPAFELVTLDFNDGSVIVPGHNVLATPGGSVNLMAQVRDTATGTYTY
jgi:hypothetical protein